MPYLTVEEMRKNVEFVKKELSNEESIGEGGSRFVGSTDADLALHFFPKEGKILECGPASGMFTKFLQDNGFKDIHVLDFIDIMVFPDRKNLTYHEVDFNKDIFPYPDQHVDGVTAWGVMEHMEDPYHFCREVHRILKNDHYFLMAVPSIFHWWSRLIFLKAGIFPRWNHRNNHIAVFPHGVFEKIFSRYFMIEQTIYTRPSLWLNIFDWTSRFLPANKWFGNYVVYVMRRKEFVSFVPQSDK